MAAMVTTPESVYDPHWYPDFGTTNHVTLNAKKKLMTKSDYNGQQPCHMGNGAGLQIKSIGTSFY